jgi:hypothetical protein
MGRFQKIYSVSEENTGRQSKYKSLFFRVKAFAEGAPHEKIRVNTSRKQIIS